MVSIIPIIIKTLLTTARSGKSHKDSTVCYFVLTMFMSFSLVLISIWCSGHFGHALYFGHNSSIIASTPSSSLLPPQIASTEKGNVYVVWVDKNYIFSTSSQDNGTTFGAPILLSDSNKLASSPQIAATEKGNVYVVWVDKNSSSGNSDIKFSSSNDSGKSFGDSKRLKGGDVLSSSPQIASTEKGNVYVVWVDKNYIFSTSSQDNGTTFGAPILLSDSNKLASSPQIASTEKGNVYVVWVDKSSSSGDGDIKFSSSNDSGKSFGDSKRLKGGDVLSSSPQIASTEKGNVYVVWVDKSSSSGDSDLKFSSSNDSGKSFDDDKRLSRNNDILSLSPQIAATEEGIVYVLRVDKNSTSGDSDVIIKVSTDRGQNFIDSVPLNEDPIEIPISSPQIVATENGYAYVVWYHHDVFFKEILYDGAILGRTVFPGNSTSLSSSPQIAATEKGNVYVLWFDKNSTDKDSILILKRIGEFFMDPN